jgi:hypothetical protein
VDVAHLSSPDMLSHGAIAEMENNLDEIEQELRTQAAGQLRASGAAWEFERRQGIVAGELIVAATAIGEAPRMRPWPSSSAARPPTTTAWSARSRSAWPATRRCRSSSCRKGSRAHRRGTRSGPSPDPT